MNDKSPITVRELITRLIDVEDKDAIISVSLFNSDPAPATILTESPEDGQVVLSTS